MMKELCIVEESEFEVKPLLEDFLGEDTESVKMAGPYNPTDTILIIGGEKIEGFAEGVTIPISRPIKGKDYVICPTSGQKLNPDTLLPLEKHVDFTNKSIL